MTFDLDCADVETYKDAVWLPCLQLRPRRPARGAVVDENGNLIKNTMLLRHYSKSGVVLSDRPDLKDDPDVRTEVIVGAGEAGETMHRFEGGHIFGGYFFEHYGHFLLETLSRLWFFKSRPDKPVVWMSFENAAPQDWHLELLRSLGVENELLCINEQAEFAELIVPEAGYVISSRFWPRQVEALQLADRVAVVPGKKVWLSRTALKKGVFVNEVQVEWILEQAGWIVFRPEMHTVPEQVKMLSDAAHIAGVEGSAFHTMVMMFGMAGKVSIFSRVDESDFDLIAQTLGVSLERIKPISYSLPRYQNSWGNEFVSWWRDIDTVLEPLGVSRPNSQPVPLKKTLRNIVCSIANYYKVESFLELNPTNNCLAAEVACKLRIAVTENALYEVAKVKASGAMQFDISPDIFLTSGCIRKPLDLFCVRNYEDVSGLLLSFNCSLDSSHSNSIWVIEAGQDDLANRELLQMINETNPSLSIAWVKGSGVAVVWRGKRPFGLPNLRAFRRTDIGQTEAPEIPCMSLNEIARQIDGERQGMRNNAI